MELTRNRALVVVGAGVLAAVLVTVLLFAGTGPERRYDERQSTDERSSAPGRPAHRVGQAVRLRTYLTTIEVRPLGFVRLGATAAGGRGVGVELTLRNVGRATYRDQPIQAASVILARGDEAERLYTSVDRCQGPPADTVRIRPGAARRYCLPFETNGAKLDAFVYAPESGLLGRRGAPQAAAWSF
jgi:hypothetical protein